MLDHSNIKMTERYAKLARRQIAITSSDAGNVGVVRMHGAKSEMGINEVRALCAREIFTRVLSIPKLLEGLVARDGIEPPTLAFSGRLPIRRSGLKYAIDTLGWRRMV